MKELSRKKIILYRILDSILLFLWPFQKKKREQAELNSFTPKRILLVEFHGIGDLVILSGVIDPIKEKWPEADIWILAKHFAQELFGHDPRVKMVFPFDFPWATWGFRYNFLAWPWTRLLKLIRCLRSINLDFVIGRPDLPMSLFISLLNAKHTFGYDLPGGTFLLTDLLPSNQTIKDHEQIIWEEYLKEIGVDCINYTPQIILNNSAKGQTAHIFNKFQESSRKLPLIGIHPGASHKLQRWPSERFSKIAEHLSTKARILWFLDDLNICSGLQDNANVIEVAAPLAAFLHLLASCDLVVCNDSGPMHLASALNTQTIAIFGPQLPERFAPHKLCQVIVANGFLCRPCANHCHYKEPCINFVSINEVLSAVDTFFPDILRKHGNL